MVANGEGRHLNTITPEQGQRIAFLNVITNWIFPMTFSLPKLAIVALLERLLSLRKPARIFFWSTSILLLLSSFILSILWYVQCTPRSHQWNPTVPGECWNPDVITNYSLYIAAFSAALDVLFALFPPFIIAGLNMSFHKRVIVSLVLASGLAAAAVVVYKTTILAQLSQEIKEDRTWSGAPILIWTGIEGDILLVVASLPTIGPFVRLVREKVSRAITSARSKWRRSPTQADREQSRRPAWRPIGMLYSGMTRLSSQGGSRGDTRHAGTSSLDADNEYDRYDGRRSRSRVNNEHV